MNCVDMDCVHCLAKDMPCSIHVTKDVVCNSIVDIYCELGHPCHVPFTDKGDRVYCDDYIRRENRANYYL